MKTSTKKLKLIALVISFVFAGTSFAYASSKKPEYKESNASMHKDKSMYKACRGSRHRMHHRGAYRLYAMKEMLSQLDLSKKQTKKITAIMENKKSKKTITMIREKQVTSMESLLEKKSFSESKANAIIGQREKNYKTIQLLNMETSHDIYQILTKEQKMKLKELMKSRYEESYHHKAKLHKMDGKSHKMDGKSHMMHEKK